jgi:hypothetical protein
MPGFSFGEGGYVPLGLSGVTVTNSKLDVYLHWMRLCAWVARFMVTWMHGYMVYICSV